MPTTQTNVTSIRCLLDLSLQGLFFNPDRPKGINFNAGGPNFAKIRVRPVDGSPLFAKELDCRVTGRFPVTKSERAFVASLIGGKFRRYRGMTFQFPLMGTQDRVLIDRNGIVANDFRPVRELYPPQLQKTCEAIESELLRIGTRFLKLLRWQQAIQGPPQPIVSKALYWQVKPRLFYAVGSPKARPVTSTWPEGIMWGDVDRDEFKSLWKNKKAEEPLAHELLREAKHLAETGPRSALLISASALEVGVKSHIGGLLPTARWLVENLPSPPIYKVLRDYLPQLPTPSPIAWPKLKTLFTKAQRLAEERNKVAHSSGHIPSDEELDEYLNCVSDLLYILDVSRGHSWAGDLVTKSTRDLMGWTLSRKRAGRGFVTTTIGD